MWWLSNRHIASHSFSRRGRTDCSTWTRQAQPARTCTAWDTAGASGRYFHWIRRWSSSREPGRSSGSELEIRDIRAAGFGGLVSVDFFTVPTLRFQILYVFLVLAHDRRRILHFGVTAHPTAEWTAQQLRDAFPWDSAPRYLLRDRDQIFGDDFSKQVQDMAIQEVLSAPRSPWQRAYVERVIGTIRRECLDHVIVFNEASLY